MMCPKQLVDMTQRSKALKSRSAGEAALAHAKSRMQSTHIISIEELLSITSTFWVSKFDLVLTRLGATAEFRDTSNPLMARYQSSI